jgi:hypothetical protein
MWGSNVATLPVVRAYLKKAQQDLAHSTSLVAEGRDMGTVVFPKARHKFFLDADSGERAWRRFSPAQGDGQARGPGRPGPPDRGPRQAGPHPRRGPAQARQGRRDHRHYPPDPAQVFERLLEAIERKGSGRPAVLLPTVPSPERPALERPSGALSTAVLSWSNDRP